MLTRFFIYGAVGCLMEVFWTGFGSLVRGEYKLKSSTSIWMFFIYGMVVFLEPVVLFAQDFTLPVRGALYMLCIFAGEYASGTLLKRADLCPWDYSESRYSVSGVIRLDYAPVWFAAGILFEQVFMLIR